MVAEAQSEGAEDRSLETRSLRGAIWSLGGHGASEAIRLASNLILTRMLAPEHFGTMLIVNVVLMGLRLFSDIGIGPSVIQHAKGEDRRFLDTAWTVQVVRGFTLWILSAVLAYPLAQVYGQPQLVALIPVAALSAAVAGFNSTSLFTLNRRLALGKLTLLEIAQQLTSIAVMVIWARLSPSVWALVAGGIAGSAFRAVASHFLVPGPKNRFAWDRETLQSITSFGRWILLSTAFSFLATRADRLILGKLLTPTDAGLYSIATVLGQNISKLASDLGWRVLFPLYARLLEHDAEQIHARLRRARGLLMAVALPPACFLAVFGDRVVELLWDPRYAGAGLMLQILSAGSIVGVVTETSIPILLAAGDSYRHMVNTVSRFVTLVACMTVGAWLAGPIGCIVGVAAAPLLLYPIIAALARRYGAWQPVVDVVAVTGSMALIALGFALRSLL